MKQILPLLFASVVLLFTASCKKDDKTDRFDVVYEVEFVATWSSSTHPTDYPSNAHFSPMIGISHPQDLEIFVPGLTASDGVKEVAETGSTETIKGEFRQLQASASALDVIEGSSFDSPGSNKAQIGVVSGYHTVTILSMIAPSPDWFVAATTSLIDPSDGLWYDSVVVDVQTYDAGTDSGSTFTSPDAVTDPKEPVTEITTGPLAEGGNEVTNMGQFIFTRIK